MYLSKKNLHKYLSHITNSLYMYILYIWFVCALLMIFFVFFLVVTYFSFIFFLSAYLLMRFVRNYNKNTNCPTYEFILYTNTHSLFLYVCLYYSFFSFSFQEPKFLNYNKGMCALISFYMYYTFLLYYIACIILFLIKFYIYALFHSLPLSIHLNILCTNQ